MKVFLDTNILICSIDPSDPQKQKTAKEILRGQEPDTSLVLSTQVFLEFSAVATRKLEIPCEDCRTFLKMLRRFEVVTVHPDMIDRALELAGARSLSIWDALILAAAESADCARLLSEDMQHGEKVAGIEIVNPFLEAA